MGKKQDLGEFDFDDLDSFDFDDGDFDQAPPKADRSPVTRAAGIAGKAGKTLVKDKQFIRDALRTALPKGYLETFDAADSLSEKAGSLYNEALGEIAPGMRDFKRATKAVLPKVDSWLPKGIAKKLKDWSDQTDEESQGYSQAKADREEMTGNLAEIFETKAQQDEAIAKQESAERLLLDKKADKRNKSQLRLLSGIQEHTARLTSYQDQVLSKFHRKSLELQYLQYFAQRDLLETTKRNNAAMLTNMADIVKNTGLPDYLKINLTEDAKKFMRQKMFGNVLDKSGFSEWSGRFSERLFQNMRSKIKDSVQGFNEAASGASQAADMLSMVDDLDPEERQALGDEAKASGIATILSFAGAGRWLGKKVGKRFKENEALNRRGAQLGNAVQGWRTHLTDWAATNTDFDNPAYELIDALKSSIGGFGGMGTKINQPSMEKDHLPTPFDGRAHRSITEVIPGLLSRILQSSESMRTGQNVDLVVYNYDRGQFTSKTRAAKDAMYSIAGKHQKDFTARVGELIQNIDPDQTLSKGARNLLKLTLVQDVAKSGNGFTPRAYSKPSKFKGADPEVAKELANHIARTYGVIEDPQSSSTGYDDFGDDEGMLSGTKRRFKESVGTIARGFDGTTDQIQRRTRDSALFDSIRAYAPELGKSLSSYANSGQKDLLYALGVLKKDGTADVVDEDFLWRYLGEAGGDTLTGLEEGENDTRNQSSLAGRKVGDRTRTRRPRKPLAAPLGSPVAAPQAAPQAVAKQAVEADTDRLIEAMLKVDPNERLNETNQILAQLLYTVDQIGRGMAPSGNGMGSGADGGNAKRSWWDIRRMAGGAAAGARWGAGKALDLSLLPLRGARWGAKKAWGGIKSAWNWAKNKLRNYSFDVYIKGSRLPALTRKGMEAKQYIDVNTKKIVRTIKDVTGPVLDAATNSIVLTEDDLEQGLVNAVGKAVKTKAVNLLGRAKDLLTGAAQKYVNLSLSPAKLLKSSVERAWNLSRNWYDIYVEGEAKPRITAWKLRAGEYFDEKGQTIKSINDIKGAVYDARGNIVMAVDDFKKGLRDQYGRKVRSLVTRGLAAGGKLVGRVVGFAKRNVMRAVRGIGKLAMAPLHGLRALGRGFANGFKAHIKFGATDNDTMQTELLGGIYELLNQRLNAGPSKFDNSGDGERDGSWRSIIKERMAKRKEAEEAKRLKEGKEPKGKPTTMWGRLLALIGGAGLYLKTLVDKVTGVGGLLKSGFSTLFEFFAKKKALDTATDIAGDLAGGGKGKGGLLWRGTKAVAKGAWNLTKGAANLAWNVGKGALGITGNTLMGGARLGMGVAQLAGRGVLALFGPVGLAVAGVATLAYGGYKLYRWLKERLKDLGYLRMAQYGFMEADEAYIEKIRKLEGGIQDYVKDNNGEPSLDPKTPWQEILSDVGIDTEDRDQLAKFLQWLQYRFVPVYMAHRKALAQYDSSETVPTEDSAKDAAKLSIARQVVAQVPATALNFTLHPFAPNAQLSDRRDEIQRRLAAIETQFGDKARPGTGSGVLELKRGGSIHSTDGTARSQYAPKSSEVKATKKATDVVMIDEAVAERERKTAMKAGNFVWGGSSAKTIDPLASVRMRAYGLVEMEVSDVAALTGLEQAVIKDVKTGFFGGRSIEGDPAVYYGKFAAVFGCAPTDETQKQKWTYWFTNRFVPVLLTLHEAFSKVSSRVTIENAWQVLSPTDQLLVAQAVVSATAVINGRELSIWAVDASPFEGKPANLDAKSCDVAIDGLKEKIKDRKVQEAANSQKRNEQQKKYGIGSNGPGYYGTGSSALSQGNGYYGMGGPGNTNQGASGGYGGGSTDPSAANYTPAAGYDHPGAGTGGDINALPQPKGNGFNNVWPLLQEVAKMVGVDPQLLATMCAVESDFKISAKAGTSSAGGLFQFIDDTWGYMLRKYGSKYGIAPNASKNDPRANALMGAEYIRENYEYLAKRIGRKPNANDMYMAHFLGPGGATQILTGSPDAIAANLNPKAAKSNPTVFYQNKGQGAPRTVRELQAEIDRRMQSKSGAYDIATAAQSATGAAASVPEKPVDPATMPAAAPAAPVKDDPTAIHDVQGGTTSAGGGLGQVAAGGRTTTPATPTSTPSPITPNTPNASAVGPKAAPTSNAGSAQLERARKEAEMARAQQAAAQQQRSAAAQAAAQTSSDLANQQLNRLVSIDQTLAKIYTAVAALVPGSDTGSASGSKQPGGGGNPEISADKRRSPIAMGSK